MGIERRGMSRRTWLKGSTALGMAGVASSLGGLALGGIGAAHAASAQFNYKVGSNVPVSHPIFIHLQETSRNILKETDGKVNISIFPNSQLGSDTEMLSQVRNGALEFLTMPGVVLATLVPMASLNSVGFAFPDYPAVWKAMDGPLGVYIRSHITKANLFVADKVWDNGFRQITSNVLIDSPAQLDNMKIRVPVSPLLVSLFKSLGASPTPINFSELYSALQTHVIDAQENPLPIIATAKINEVQKHCALTSHVWDGYWMLGNKNAWSALPASLQDIVHKNFNLSAVGQRADNEKLAIDLQQSLSTKGLTFNKVDPTAFRKKLAAGGFYASWKQKFGDEAWAQLEAAAGKLA